VLRYVYKKGGENMNERIKEVRNALNLTQQEFADKIKVKRNTVATYEMGRSVPSDSAVALICREFNVNEDWLRTGTGEMFVKKTRDEQIASFIGSIQSVADDSFKKRFISMLSSLDESDWETLEKIAVSLHKKKD
jgi:transcriptional regulator with XRE-family HTH domain